MFKQFYNSIILSTLFITSFASAELIRISDMATITTLQGETSAVYLKDDTSGQILGAYNIDVSGTAFDVSFIDGIFDASYLVGNNFAEVTVFSDALIADIFDPLIAGLSSFSPDMIAGCGSPTECRIFTPWSSAFGVRSNIGPTSAASLIAFFGGADTSDNTVASMLSVWAAWGVAPSSRAVANVNPVSEPSSLALLSLALIASARVFRRK